MAKIKHSYSFELNKRENGANFLIPSGVFKIENCFESFPSTLDIAKYIAENKDKFFQETKRDSIKIDYNIDIFCINNADIKYHDKYGNIFYFYVTNIQQIK